MNLFSDRLNKCRNEKALRENRKIPWYEVAKAAGVSPPAVTIWLKDGNGINATQARKLADYFDVDPIWLETGEVTDDSICYPIRAKFHFLIQSVIDLMMNTDEKGKAEILSRAQDVWELREVHLRNIGQSPARNDTQRKNFAERNKDALPNVDRIFLPKNGEQ
jgi:transcriptional regulator with XRE-family HTH domain